MKLGLPLLLLAALLVLEGCRCDPRRESPRLSAQQALQAERERSALRALGVREQMRRLQRLTSELRRRALGGASWAAPAQRLAGLVQAIDPRATLPGFSLRLRALQGRADALVAAPRPLQVQAFNALVTACRACHARHAGSAAARRLSDQSVPALIR
ncbi:MAG: hypothetical protein IPG96_13210 [Proteobacteria bacterium]|nr:hypothetical protein [Pseudomonadota bacterium]